MAVRTCVNVEIETIACNKCGQDLDANTTIRPGNALEGRIHVVSPSPIQLTAAKVLLQGS